MAGLGSHTFNSRFGPTRNPWNRDWSSGGSSGGAAAAVASGILKCADGTDMMGSLRNPAGWNGIYSLRPTAGIMQEDGDDNGEGNPLPYPISTLGPLARTISDMARLFQTLAPPRSCINVSSVLQYDPSKRRMVALLLIISLWG